ncbi:hypothetical protein PN36_07620 [Candidatus Thiomargarita nelsonii]|uniref:Putative restriction endonuclease domain-containing protein n=1 Tax=Candidatus Thiomargarita nelsonii TaxID=1003181 RepID=A0A0A6P2M2_9GAMM|nr:hypothetical protein PN36_07620 [Candidatus Thiomargarita nelsonii]
MGSLNHSLTAGRIAGLLFNDERFEVMPELSLDGSQIELIPNLAVYTDPPPQASPMDDVLMVSQMPDLIIEVLSPKQRISDIFVKFKAYFALGVKSCWLALPLIEVIDVYSQPDQHRTFDLNDS